VKELLQEFLSDLLTEETSAAKQAKEAGLKAIPGSRGLWSKTGKAPATHSTKGGKFTQVTVPQTPVKKSTPTPSKPIKTPSAPKKQKTQPSVQGKSKTPTSIDQDIQKLPGGKGIYDAIMGIVEKGSAGAGTPESRAAEASVVLISNSLLRGRKSFRGDMDSYLRNNDQGIDDMIEQLSTTKGSKLTQDWKKSVKAQIVATLSQTEKQYGRIESLVWDNAEGRSSMGLPKGKDMNDRSDLYIRTTSGDVIGVSLKKSGKIFLANQGYAKIIGTIETFTDDQKAKSQIQSLKRLHKQSADISFQHLSKFIKSNKKQVRSALATFDRTGVKSLSSPKYDPYFNPNGTPNKKFLDNVTSDNKLSSNEFKALMKCLDGVKKNYPPIKKVMDVIRDVDVTATKQFLNVIESNREIREATTRYLLDALDIPQMLSDTPTPGVDKVVTVYGEGNTDDNGNPVPMYINDVSLRETFGISKKASTEDALKELRTRFIIDPESDKRTGMIRLRITNKTPPPNYYYPTVATLALRARGLGTAAAFELYQHDSWTYTLASKSPNPENWTPQQRKKHAESTIKFLQSQMKRSSVTKQEKMEIQKDIDFYSGIQ
jgi:hypothetical protein